MVSEKQTGTWGWIIGILVAVAVVWWIAAVWNGDERAQRTSEQPAPESNDTSISESVPESTVEESVTTETEPTTDTTTATTASENVDFVITEESELTENPDKYIGATLAVEGEINEKVGSNAFTVDTDGLIGGSEVLVISKTQNGTDIEKGEKIRVVGKARKFSKTDIAAIENEIGYDLPDDAFAGYDERVIVLADTVSASAH